MNSAEKLLTLLKILAQKPYKFGVTELSERINCGKSGTFKLLSAMVQQGLAAQTPDHKYTLGIGSYLIGRSYEENVGVARFAKPYISRLRDLTDENVSFVMLIDGVATQIYREESRQMLRVVGNVGGSRPINAGATGKLLAAFEDETAMRQKLMEAPLEAYTPNTITSPQALLEEFAKIRAQGYAVSSQEYSLGTIGVAAPVRDGDGRVWAAISIGAPTMRITPDTIERFIYLLTETAAQMGRELSGQLTMDTQEG